MPNIISDKSISKNDLEMYDFRDKKINQPLIFSNCEFDTDVLFQYSTIDSRVLFEECTFNGKLIFGDKNNSYHAIVSQNIECNNCKFNDKVLLDGLICNGNIFFNNCMFLYKSIDNEDFGLSINRSKVDNSIQIRNSKLLCGIDFSNSSISHNGCSFENVSIKAKKGELKFTSCHVGKELSFTNCSIIVDRIMMDQLGVDNITGSVKFVGGRKILERIELNEDDLKLIKNPNTRNNLILTYSILEKHGGFVDFLVMRENITTVKTGEGYLCFKKTKYKDTFYYEVFSWSVIKVNRDLFLSNGNLGNTFFIENTEIHCGILDVQESKCGSFTIDNAIIETTVWDLRSMQISNCFNINHTLCQFFDQRLDTTNLFKKDKFAHIQLCSTEIGHNFDLYNIGFEIADTNGMPFFDKNGNIDKEAKNIYVDSDHMKVGGSLTIENLAVVRESRLIDTKNESEEIQHVLNVNLEATCTETSILNFTDNNWCNLFLEDFKFSNILINGKLPGKSELVAMIPKESSFLSGKKYDKIIGGIKQGCKIQTGIIGFMRECQDKLILSKDGYDEANEIWRLRNQMRLYQQYKNKKIKYSLYKAWNNFTDFGLSSTTIIYVVLGVFFLYLGLNIIVLSIYTQYDVTDDKMSIVGQSLIQYIPTIDFGDELKIINFEQGLPNGYKYLVIAARITGFILISILVASLGGLWKGRNK